MYSQTTLLRKIFILSIKSISYINSLNVKFHPGHLLNDTILLQTKTNLHSNKRPHLKIHKPTAITALNCLTACKKDKYNMFSIDVRGINLELLRHSGDSSPAFTLSRLTSQRDDANHVFDVHCWVILILISGR